MPVTSIETATTHEDPLFAQAIQAVATADLSELSSLLKQHPQLVVARSKSEHKATLLHYVSSNAIEDAIQLSPQQIYNVIRSAEGKTREDAVQRAIEVPKLLIAAGAEVDALAECYGGGPAQTTLNLLVSSGHPSVAGVLPQLTDVLCAAGANLDGLDGKSTPLVTALGFGHPQAAAVLVEHGCKVDSLLLAAAAGDISMLEKLLVDGVFSTENTERIVSNWFTPAMESKSLAELALVFASMCGRVEAIRFLVNAGVDVDAVPEGTFMTAGPLHTAAMVCQEKAVRLLIELGADPTVVEPRYQSDAYGWARHGSCPRIVQLVGEYKAEFVRKQVSKSMGAGALEEFREAVFSGDVDRVKACLDKYDFTPEQLDGPWFYFDTPAVVQSKSNLELVDVLLAAGASINQKSLWWAGGYGVLDDTDADLASQLLARGAELDVWSAAQLGNLPVLSRLIEEDPQRVQARGPDGKTALHCSTTVEVAETLLELGADPNKKCWDHSSTAAQYAVAKYPEVAKRLIAAGCKTDLLMAAALGDVELAGRLLADDPECIRTIVSRKWFPSTAADCIYSWSLGWYLTAHQVADKFDHSEMVDFLFTQGDAANQYLNAGLLGRQDVLDRLLQEDPNVASSLSEAEQVHLAHAARNNDTAVVARLLELSFDVGARGQHEATALHWAAFHGNVSMAQALIASKADLERRNNEFSSTPLSWAFQGCKSGWFKDSGDFAGVVRLLLESGSKLSPDWKPTGVDKVDEVVHGFSN